MHIQSVYILPPELIGNTTGLFLFRTKKLKNLGPRNMYSYLFTMDSLYLIQILVQYLQNSYNYDFTIQSELFCKMYQYFSYSLCPVSGYILGYISLDRCVAIRAPSKRFILRKTRNQLIYFLSVFLN